MLDYIKNYGVAILWTLQMLSMNARNNTIKCWPVVRKNRMPRATRSLHVPKRASVVSFTFKNLSGRNLQTKKRAKMAEVTTMA